MKNLSKQSIADAAKKIAVIPEQEATDEIIVISKDIAIAFMVWKDENQSRFTTFSGGHGFDRTSGERLTAAQLMEIFWKEKIQA